MHDTRSIPVLFDSIAGRYDMLNTVLSLGRESSWRKRTAARARSLGAGIVLDLAAGTGEQLAALLERAECIRTVVGLDISREMTERAERKLRGRFRGRASIVMGDACRVPFGDGTFDLVTISFGMRNLSDRWPALFDEILRVLKPGGHALFLELTPPEHPVTRIPALIWLRAAVPLLGSLLTGDREAYRYLVRSIEQFPKHAAFMEKLRAAGFAEVSQTPMTFGAVRLFKAMKPRELP